jgi:hypothetical protein
VPKRLAKQQTHFLGMMEPQEAQAQPEVQEELESEVAENEEYEESEQSDDYEEEQEEPTPHLQSKSRQG